MTGSRSTSRALRTRVESAVQRTDHRTVTVPVDEVQPEVTKADLAAQYPTYLTVDESTFTLTLWKDLKVGEEVHGRRRPAGLPDPDRPLLDPEQAGRSGLERPELRLGPGSSAARSSPGGTAENPLKARWMGITDGAGFHGTVEVSSLGTAASHGCVRMAVPDVDRALRPGRRRHPDLHRLRRRRWARALGSRRAGARWRSSRP